MKKKNVIFIVVVFMLIIGAVGFAMENKHIEQKAVIAGTVTKAIKEGDLVKAGDSLVEISTLTGTISASRANVNGVVKQVLVVTGDEIKSGQIVAYIKQVE